MPSPFGKIEPVLGAPMDLLLLFSDPFADYRDGTTSRVYRYIDDRVILVTSCDVKTAFLKALAQVPGGIPGLPVVHRYIGCYAQDEDDRSLWGECFEVEELWYPPTKGDKERQSRFCALAHALVGFDFGFEPMQDARLADVLAAANMEGTGSAFRFIADFLSKHNAVLDALVPRNVMFTKAGKLCLADAVTFVPPPLEHEMTVFPGTVIRANKRDCTAELIGRGLRDALFDEDDDEDGRGKTAADAVESLLLALAATGYDLGTPAGREAVKSALEAIGQNL